jgi:hypothetical protein
MVESRRLVRFALIFFRHDRKHENTMALAFESEQERQLHQATAEHLAREMRVAEDRVLEAYGRELEQLQGAARLKTFLPVLAPKRVKAFFSREERSARQGSAYRFA